VQRSLWNFGVVVVVAVVVGVVAVGGVHAAGVPVPVWGIGIVVVVVVVVATIALFNTNANGLGRGQPSHCLCGCGFGRKGFPTKRHPAAAAPLLLPWTVTIVVGSSWRDINPLGGGAKTAAVLNNLKSTKRWRDLRIPFVDKHELCRFADSFG